jgi:hypothetical protein
MSCKIRKLEYNNTLIIPWVRNSKKLEKPFDKEPLAGRGL